MQQEISQMTGRKLWCDQQGHRSVVTQEFLASQFWLWCMGWRRLHTL